MTESLSKHESRNFGRMAAEAVGSFRRMSYLNIR
jgi:hypothetical protein